MNFHVPDERFKSTNTDIVGPLPTCKGFRYVLTAVDKFSVWIEPIPTWRSMRWYRRPSTDTKLVFSFWNTFTINNRPRKTVWKSTFSICRKVFLVQTHQNFHLSSLLKRTDIETNRTMNTTLKCHLIQHKSWMEGCL